MTRESVSPERQSQQELVGKGLGFRIRIAAEDFPLITSAYFPGMFSEEGRMLLAPCRGSLRLLSFIPLSKKRCPQRRPNFASNSNRSRNGMLRSSNELQRTLLIDKRRRGNSGYRSRKYVSRSHDYSQHHPLLCHHLTYFAIQNSRLFVPSL